MKKYVIENDDIICKELELKYVNSDDMFSLGSNEWFDENGMIISEENIFDTFESAKKYLIIKLNKQYDCLNRKASKVFDKLRKVLSLKE